jgi:hypothetical protein
MNEIADYKACIYCKKEVSKTATKCPYCREWLTKREFSFRNPYLQLGLILIIFYAAVKLISYFVFANQLNRIGLTGPLYSKKTSKVTIKEHKLIKRKNSFAIIGIVENNESFKWANLSFVVAFKDKKGTLSSLGSGYVQAVEPHSQKPFEASIGCSQEPYDGDKYASYEIEIDDGRGEGAGVR